MGTLYSRERNALANGTKEDTAYRCIEDTAYRCIGMWESI